MLDITCMHQGHYTSYTVNGLFYNPLLLAVCKQQRNLSYVGHLYNLVNL